jgi:hypothetical protein
VIAGEEVSGPRWEQVLWLVLGALVFLTFGYTEMAGSDLWWHLAAGRDIAAAGTPWLADTWSYSAAGQPWNNHEWLADLVYYGWASAFGVDSLVYWKWLVVIATFLLLQQSLYRQSGDAFSSVFMSTLALAIAAPFIDIRPHLYSLLGFTLIIHMTLGRRPSPVGLFVLFLVWANLHGGFVFGLMALALLVCPWREPGVAPVLAAARLVVPAFLACLINPDGWNVFILPFIYAFDSSSPYRQLAEWLGPFKPGGIRSPVFFYTLWTPALVLLYLLPRIRKELPVPWEGLALTLLTLAMALTSRRFIPLFGISLALVLAPLLAAFCRRSVLLSSLPVTGLLALTFGVLRLLPYPLQAAPAFHYQVAEYSYPVDLLNYIEANQLTGNVYALYNWGGYIHWRTGGRMKVFIDGRANTIFDAQHYYHYVSVLGSEPGWIERVEDTGAEFMLWPHQRGKGREKLEQLVATKNWRPLYRDATGWLLVRNTVRLPETLQRSPQTPWRDLGEANLAALSGDFDRGLELGLKTLIAIPWQRDACVLVASLYRAREEPELAGQVVSHCRSYYPSRYLK